MRGSCVRVICNFPGVHAAAYCVVLMRVCLSVRVICNFPGVRAGVHCICLSYVCVCSFVRVICNFPGVRADVHYTVLLMLNQRYISSKARVGLSAVSSCCLIKLKSRIVCHVVVAVCICYRP